MSILNIYKRDTFNKTLRVGTPDVTKYHDTSSVRLEGAESNHAPLSAKIPPNSKFSLPGVIIPRATRLGASLGNNHEKPIKVYIDPDFNNRQFVVNLDSIRRNPEKMSDAIEQANRAGYTDPADAMIEPFGAFAENLPNHSEPVATVYREPLREAPLQAPDLYVVPDSNRGNNQLRPANFTGKPQTKVSTIAPEPLPIKSMPQESITQAVKSIRSLHQELSGTQTAPVQIGHRPTRKVVFELPSLGQASGSLGQFTCAYHEVIRSDNNLILIYDHNCPAQMSWTPPTLEDPSGTPIAIAVKVEGCGGEPTRLYLAYPTGVQFKYRSEEFTILTIEKSKDIKEVA